MLVGMFMFGICYVIRRTVDCASNIRLHTHLQIIVQKQICPWTISRIITDAKQLQNTIPSWTCGTLFSTTVQMTFYVKKTVLSTSAAQWHATLVCFVLGAMLITNFMTYVKVTLRYKKLHGNRFFFSFRFKYANEARVSRGNYNKSTY